MKQHELVTEPQRSEAVNAARAVLQTLVRRGVTVAYGIPGGLISPVFDALASVPEIRYIATRHEAMAGFAAMGHAIATGRPALVLTTGGPGVTNAITPVAAAFLEEVPMFVVSGDVPTGATGRGALHDTSQAGLDGLALMRTITRFCARIESADAAVGAVEEAMRLAMGPRPGPVFLSLPLDVGAAPATQVRLSISEPPPPAAPDPAACREVSAALRAARRPLMVIGNGARGAAVEVRALAERLACPVVTTPHAKGVFPDSHPLHLGGIGFGGNPSAIDYLQSGPDVVLVVGSRLGDLATNGWRLAVRGTKATYQVDREAWILGRNTPLTLGIVGDARAALRGMISELPHDVARPLRQATHRTFVSPESMTSDALPLMPGRVMAALQAAFPEAFWAVDVGEHAAYALHYLTIDQPDHFRVMMGLASMGSGIGIAVGARAATNKTVVCICGDGCFSMVAGEVLTLAENGIGVVLVVMNDGCWNMVDKGFEAVYGRLPSNLPSRPADIAGVASSFGAIGVRVTTPADLDVSRLRGLLDSGRPVVVDVRFDSARALSTKSRNAFLKDGIGARR